MPSIVIRSLSNGEMNYDDLKEAIQLHCHQPAIILANIGTTMTEAKDDVSSIRAVLKECAIKSHYIHCDAALAGTYRRCWKIILPLILLMAPTVLPSVAQVHRFSHALRRGDREKEL